MRKMRWTGIRRGEWERKGRTVNDREEEEKEEVDKVKRKKIRGHNDERVY